MQVLRDRIKKLEEGKEESVEDVLSKFSSLLVRKNPPFDKDEALDVLIELKVVARLSNHAKLPYFQAVFQALKNKTSASPDQFRKYLVALLGDMYQERGLDVMSKVDKSVRRLLLLIEVLEALSASSSAFIVGDWVKMLLAAF